MVDGSVETGVEPDPIITLLEGLLDWPFLFFLLIAGIVLFARPEVFSLLSTRKFTVKLGGNEITIGDALEKLNDDSSITAADLEALQAQIDELKSKRDQLQGDEQAPVDAAHADDVADDVVVGQLRNGLLNSKYTWRSIERLALDAGVSEDRAFELLTKQLGVKVSLGKSGRKIARLLSSN